MLYDPRKVTYSQLLDVFWRNIDPLTANAQFCDIGSQYRAGIFAHDETQRRLAEESKRAVAQRLGKPVVTEVAAASRFWPAEEYHQDYYKKNPVRYNLYRAGCGRDQRLEAIWGPARRTARELADRPRACRRPLPPDRPAPPPRGPGTRYQASLGWPRSWAWLSTTLSPGPGFRRAYEPSLPIRRAFTLSAR